MGSSGRNWLILAWNRPSLPDCVRTQAEFDRCWLEIEQIRPLSAQFSTSVVLNSGQFWSTSVRVGPDLTVLGSSSASSDAICIKSGPPGAAERQSPLGRLVEQRSVPVLRFPRRPMNSILDRRRSRRNRFVAGVALRGWIWAKLGLVDMMRRAGSRCEALGLMLLQGSPSGQHEPRPQLPPRVNYRVDRPPVPSHVSEPRAGSQAEPSFCDARCARGIDLRVRSL